MKRRNLGSLTILALIGTGSFVATTPAQALVARFCDAVLRGRAPDDKDARAIAEALLPIASLDGRETADVMREVASRLGALRKPGKELSAEKLAIRHAASVASYFEAVERRVAAGEPRTEAERRARREISERLGIGDRAMRDRIRRHRIAAMEIVQQNAQVAEFVSHWKRNQKLMPPAD